MRGTRGAWVYVVSGVTTNYYSASNQIRLYADAGSTVYVNANFAAVTQRSVTISGYLEDAS